MEGTGTAPGDPDPPPPPPLAAPRPVEGPPGPPRFGPLNGLLVFLAYLGGQLVAGLAIGVVAGIRSALSGRPTADLLDESMPAALLLGLSLGGAGALLTTRLLVAAPLRGPAGEGFGLRPAKARQMLLGAAAGLLLGLLLLGVTTLAPPGDLDTPFARVARTEEGFWSLVLLALLIAPPVEEFVFRGVLYRALRARLPTAAAALAVTLLFAALHATEAIHYKPAFAVIALLGLATLALRVGTGSLFPAVAAHLVYNACAVAL